MRERRCFFSTKPPRSIPSGFPEPSPARPPRTRCEPVSTSGICFGVYQPRTPQRSVRDDDHKIGGIRFIPGFVDTQESVKRILLFSHFPRCHAGRSQSGGIGFSTSTSLNQGGRSGFRTTGTVPTVFPEIYCVRGCLRPRSLTVAVLLAFVLSMGKGHWRADCVFAVVHEAKCTFDKLEPREP